MSDPSDDGRQESSSAPSPQSGGTGGGGNATRDKAARPTAEALTPSDLPEDSRPRGVTDPAGARGGSASGLHPGGTTPSNSPLVGEGKIGSGGGSSGPTGDAG
jgi:hypothetical protein